MDSFFRFMRRQGAPYYGNRFQWKVRAAGLECSQVRASSLGYALCRPVSSVFQSTLEYHGHEKARYAIKRKCISQMLDESVSQLQWNRESF
jgi:hypothetical protein